MKRVVVTGCLGFIESHFVREIINNYDDVYVIDIIEIDIIDHPSPFPLLMQIFRRKTY